MNCRLTACASYCLMLLTTTAPARAADALTVVSYGGQYTASQTKAQYEPFTAKTGTAIQSVDYNGGLAELIAQVRSGTVSWDVVDVEQQDLERGCADGLFEKVDPKGLPAGNNGAPAEADFLPGALRPCGVGSVVWSNVIAFNQAAFPQVQPKRLEDFFDIKSFPGKRGLPKRPNALLEWALMADGVPAKDVYATLSTSQGLDRAFAKLDTIKNQAVFWETGAQMVQLLADGEVAISAAYNGRVQGAITDDKKPLAILWDRQIWNADYYAIVAGTKKRDDARAFVAFATGTEPLAAQTRYLTYGPVRRSAQALVDHAIAANLPTTPGNFQNALAFDAKWWTEHGDAVNERYVAWLSQ